MTHRDGFPRLSARSAWRGDAGHRKPRATRAESLGKPQAMRGIVKAFRRPPAVRPRDRNGGFPRLSDGVAHRSRRLVTLRRGRLARAVPHGSPGIGSVFARTTACGTSLGISSSLGSRNER